MGANGNDGGKYARLREGATRAERKEATFDDMMRAAEEMRAAAADLRETAEASRAGQAAIAADAASLAACARLIACGSEEPAELYRKQMYDGAYKAAAEMDFDVVLENAAEGFIRAADEATKATREACASVRNAWDGGLAQRRLAAMGRVFAIGCIVLTVCCAGLTAICVSKFWPVFTGVAVVSYEPGYESELDKTRLELEFARNEIDAYRRQFPTGIGPTAQADLDAANQAAQEAYDAAHAE